MAPRARRRGLILACVTAVALALGGCSEHDSPRGEEFAYAVDAPLATLNAGSTLGASTNAELVAARVYPGVYVPGPNGQMIPNTDLAKTQFLPSENPQVVYTINQDAHFADGDPITCDDFLLATTAAQLPDVFGSHMPVFRDVIDIDCSPGRKKFTVTFAKDRASSWRMLFGPGTVLPLHTIKAKVAPSLSDEDLNAALYHHNVDALRDIARAWNESFRLDSFDPTVAVSAGPYKVTSVGTAGELHLEANDAYYGDAPETPALSVYPGSADVPGLATAGDLKVADRQDASFVHRDDPTNPFDRKSVVGALTDTLVLSDKPDGLFHDPEVRHQLADCLDRTAIARISSEHASVTVPPVASHVLSAGDPRQRVLAGITEPKLTPTPRPPAPGIGAPETGDRRIRIGYLGPNPRLAAMVEGLKGQCPDFTIEDASGQVGQDPWAALKGDVDAIIMPIDPTREYGHTGATAESGKGIVSREEELWNESYYLPLAAQPRTFIVNRGTQNVEVFSGPAGIGWNMDRWKDSP